MFHVRCLGKEKHLEQMAQRKVDEAAYKAEAIKARYREMLSVEQPSLTLETRQRPLNDEIDGDRRRKR
jgi:hypothetical protein